MKRRPVLACGIQFETQLKGSFSVTEIPAVAKRVGADGVEFREVYWKDKATELSVVRERMAELRRRWEEEHARLIELVRTLQQQAKVSDAMAAKYRVMVRRLERFEAAGPPPDKPTEQRVTMRLRGGRTGVRAVIC